VISVSDFIVDADMRARLDEARLSLHARLAEAEESGDRLMIAMAIKAGDALSAAIATGTTYTIEDQIADDADSTLFPTTFRTIVTDTTSGFSGLPGGV